MWGEQLTGRIGLGWASVPSSWWRLPALSLAISTAPMEFQSLQLALRKLFSRYNCHKDVWCPVHGRLHDVSHDAYVTHAGHAHGGRTCPLHGIKLRPDEAGAPASLLVSVGGVRNYAFADYDLAELTPQIAVFETVLLLVL